MWKTNDGTNKIHSHPSIRAIFIHSTTITKKNMFNENVELLSSRLAFSDLDCSNCS